jgi:hypothetical protein
MRSNNFNVDVATKVVSPSMSRKFTWATAGSAHAVVGSFKSRRIVAVT